MPLTDWTDLPPFTVGQVVDEDDMNAVVANEELVYNAHGARAHLTSNQSLTSATATAISLTTEDFDSDAFHSTSSNQARMVVPTGGGGIYIVHAQVEFAPNSTGVRTATLRLNGTTSLAVAIVGPVASVDTIVDVTTLAALSATDYLELLATQNSGGALNAIAGAAATFLELTWRGKL